MRTRVHFLDSDYSGAQFTATDLWLDQQTIPDLWNNSVLHDHLTADPLAHDWTILTDESWVVCEADSESQNSCQVNLRFKRDFNTEDTRDHEIIAGLEQDF